ncbi:RagB/SusD family nutrient uptake outer membrane protein [Puteibacter caeruleilacunae]|nr:RagB/SusD family nutrient uptake outer membrane protein [Puteibacter caeruleilacunae]
MRKIYNNLLSRTAGILLLAVTTGMFVGCKDDLEIDPVSFYSETSFFKTVEHANLAVKGIYDVLTTKYTYGHQMSLNWPMDNDVTYVKGTGFSNDNRRIAHYGLTPGTAYVERTWEELYTGVNRANLAIAKIQEMDLFTNGTEEQKAALNQYLGEAKFMRAFLYFDLARLWGDVPLLTKPTSSSDDFMVSRTDRNVVFDQVIQDLKDAKDLSPLNFDASNDRANQGAIRGYLVRALLYRGSYYLSQEGTMTRSADYKEFLKQAAAEAKELVNLGGYDLLDSYEQVFRNLTSFIQDPTENLFEIAMYNVAHDSEDAGIIGTWNSPKTDAKSVYGRANAYVLVRPQFANEYEDGDVRRDVSVAAFEIKKDGSHKDLADNKAKYPGKWRRDLIAEPPQNPNNTNVNWCTLRYADVLLMLAEAVNEVRDELPGGVTLQDGFDAINAVRTRAQIDPLENTLSYDDFKTAIETERKLELMGEGWRKYDLIRWNKMGETLRETQALMKDRFYKDNEEENSVGYVAGVFFTDNKHELMPIPQRERDENQNLSQNPGY